MVQMPDGTMVEQGGPEDRATWWTCGFCGFHGPHVGKDADGRKACIGSCGPKPFTWNPNVPRDPSYWEKKRKEEAESGLVNEV